MTSQVIALRKNIKFFHHKKTDLLSVDLAQLIDYLHEDMQANDGHPEVQTYIQLLLRQLEYVGVPS